MADRPDDPDHDPTDSTDSTDPTDPTPLTTPPDPELERRVRDLLARQAEQIRPGDRFAEIEAAAGQSRPARGWLWPVAVAAVVLVVVGVVGIPRLIGRESPTSTSAENAPADATRPAPIPSPARSASATPQDEQSSPAASGPAPTGSAATAPTRNEAYAVYYLGSSVQRTEAGGGAARIKLYREFHRLPVVSSKLTKVAAAVTAMATIRPDDPDYQTAWPTIGAVEVTAVDGGLRINLDGDGFPAALPNSFTAAEALQQLVWTATAAYGDLVPVTVLVDGGTNVSWGKDLFGKPVTRDAALQAAVWITDPVTGQRDRAGRVTVLGVGTAFEATLGYQIRDATSGDVLLEGTTQGGANGDYAPFELSVDLKPGTYTVVVYAPDASGANPLGEGDSKTWSVA